MAGNSLFSVLERGFSILEAFSPSSPRLRLKDIVERTKLPKATVIRFLKGLLSLKYVTYDPLTGTYHLSPKVMSLGYVVLSSIDVREVALPILQELSDKTGQNVNLGILDGCEIVYIERIKKRQILNIELYVGSRLSAHNTSIGQVILAYMEDWKLAQILAEIKKKYSDNSLEVDLENLKERLKEIRAKGYAVNDESYVKGLRAIAAPIFNHEGVVDAAVNIPVFANLVTLDELLHNYLPSLLDAASRISRLRGYEKI